MSKIQTIIIPRNWLFGRLCFVAANLKNMKRVNKNNFTDQEMEKIEDITKSLDGLIKGKKENSEVLKKLNRKP